MSEENTENNIEIKPETKPAVNFNWEFEGRTYELFLVNRTGAVGMPIMNPRDKTKAIGAIKAEFMWQSSDPFLDRLDIETIDKAAQHSDWTERENESMMLKNARCYSEIVQCGESIQYDELGEVKSVTRKDREGMTAYRKPVQSDLISYWLREFHIERFLPEGMDALDALLSNPEELHFTCKVGDYDNPQHLLLFRFKTPTDDAISAYQGDTFKRRQNTEGDWKHTRDNEHRLKFARKYLVSVSGAMIGPAESFEFDDSKLIVVKDSDEESLTLFKKNFNPDWLIRLADEIAGAFNLGKK